MGRGKVKPNYTGINNALPQSALKSEKVQFREVAVAHFTLFASAKIENQCHAFEFSYRAKFQKQRR